MHTRRPALFFVIVGLVGALLFTGTAAAETAPEDQPTPTPVPTQTPPPEQPPSTVLVCNLWDGEPYDYWKVQEMSPADADWWIANSANASIVEGAGSCPGNTPVSLCIPYGDLDKLIVVEPWDANWYLANHDGATKAVDGSCDADEVITDPKPEPTTKPEPEPTTKPEPEPTTEPEPEPTTEPKPEPTTVPTGGGVDDTEGAGGSQAPTTGADAGDEQPQELAVTGVESWHLALAGLTMVAIGLVIDAGRRRLVAIPTGGHGRR